MFFMLVPLLAVAVNLILLLGLFVSLNRSVQKLKGRVQKAETKVETECGQMVTGMTELKRQVTNFEGAEFAPAQEAVAISSAGINTTLRSKVLKMHRLGQASEKIAEALRVPRGEVDLLVKVHQIIMRPYQDAPPNPSSAVKKA